VTGYNVEYSAMALHSSSWCEYANMACERDDVISCFLGGWLPPFDIAILKLDPAGVVWFSLKVR